MTGFCMCVQLRRLGRAWPPRPVLLLLSVRCSVCGPWRSLSRWPLQRTGQAKPEAIPYKVAPTAAFVHRRQATGQGPCAHAAGRTTQPGQPSGLTCNLGGKCAAGALAGEAGRRGHAAEVQSGTLAGHTAPLHPNWPTYCCTAGHAPDGPPTHPHTQLEPPAPPAPIPTYSKWEAGRGTALGQHGGVQQHVPVLTRGRTAVPGELCAIAGARPGCRAAGEEGGGGLRLRRPWRRCRRVRRPEVCARQSVRAPSHIKRQTCECVRDLCRQRRRWCSGGVRQSLSWPRRPHHRCRGTPPSPGAAWPTKWPISRMRSGSSSGRTRSEAPSWGQRP